ncbi:MAG: homocysteine S-methyltransferase family protein [Isosphaeraceae bacterium]
MKLLDAAMGTRLMARGLNLATADPCLWNLSHADSVFRVHSADLAAGAQCISTNTFGANRFWLGRYASADQTAIVNQEAVAIARRAISESGKQAEIAGSIGPTAFFDEKTLREQIEILMAAGVDSLIFETLAPPAARQLCQWQIQKYSVEIWVSFFDWGTHPHDQARMLLESGFKTMGLNCMNDKRKILHVLKQLSDINAISLFLKPSRMHFPSVLAMANQFSAKGLNAIGGCCGTDEHWIRMLASRLITSGFSTGRLS